MEAPAVEHPEDAGSVVVPVSKPKPTPTASKLKTSYVTGQYGVQPATVASASTSRVVTTYGV